MPLEPTFDNLDDLDAANPFADDPVSEGDDHLRGIKKALLANVTGDAAETRLLVAAVVAAVVDALAFSLKDLPLLDIDNSAADEQTRMAVRNINGGWDFGAGVSPLNLFTLQQLDSAGVQEKLVMFASRDLGVTINFDDLNAFSTISPTRNSSAEVRDIDGTARPIGYNTLPPTTITSNTFLETKHNGQLLEITNNITITIANLFQGFAFNVICAATVGDIAVPSGTTVFFYEGFQRRNFVGPATMNLNLGSALTFTQNTGTSWNAWGGDVA